MVLEFHRPRLSGQLAESLALRWVDPGLLCSFEALRRDISPLIAVGTVELSGCEVPRFFRQRPRRRDLRCGFRNHPVLASSWDLVGADLDKPATFDWEEVTGGEHFDIDDGKNTVIVLVLVNLAGDLLVSNMMDLLVDGLVDYSCF